MVLLQIARSSTSTMQSFKSYKQSSLYPFRFRSLKTIAGAVDVYNFPKELGKLLIIEFVRNNMTVVLYRCENSRS